MNKKDLRKQMRNERDAMAAADVAAHSLAITQRVLACPRVRDAKSIFIYVSIGNEVDTHALIRSFLDAEKTVCVPVIDRTAERMLMYPCCIRSFTDLQPDANTYGILSPVPPLLYDGTIDLCIMPGVAFTKHGDRLGMGAGFYDRFLAAHPQMPTVALAHDWQLLESVPHEQHDRAVDVIVTETRIVEARHA